MIAIGANAGTTITAILGSMSANENGKRLAAQKRIHQFDIYAMCKRYIKAIGGPIVAVISDTALSRREQQSPGLQWLREANIQLVEAVKDTARLQENLIRYVGSENERMCDVYNRTRVQPAIIIREPEDMRTCGGGVIDVLSPDALRLLVAKDQRRCNQTVTGLIGRRAVTLTSWSSLINDGVFTHDIAMNLIQAAQVLFVTVERDLTQAVLDVALDKSDLDRLDEQTGTQTANG